MIVFPDRWICTQIAPIWLEAADDTVLLKKTVLQVTMLLSVVECLWEVFVWGCGVLFLSCVSVSVSGVLFSVGVYVCVTC